ncbi:MAG TPA: hypothetical protein VHL79_12315 [Ramlibacter sp.]|jgi:hypothetical protein|nr:hypothetical protein [Ramlibacter sp.]
MGFKLAIGNRVAVQIKGKLPGDSRGSHVNVNFTLEMDRMSQDEVNAAYASGDTFADFIVKKCHGWDGQRLVLDESTGNPAAYSEEAMRALLNAVPDMALWVWRSYMRDLGMQEKN